MENYIRPKIVNKDEGIYGHVDFVNVDGIGGWVIDVKNPEEQRYIEIYINDIKVCEKIANLHRPDIESIIGKKANCGFFVKWSEIELPPKISKYEEIHIRVVDKISQREIIGRHVDRKKAFLPGGQSSEYKYFIGKDEKYHNWILKNEVEGIKIEEIKKEISMFKLKPKISILMPTYNTPKHLLRETIESVINQIYDNWELCIADDNSSMEHVKKIIEEYRSKYPEKIKVRYRDTNGHICEASNTALELATGEYIALLDHDDILTPFALYYVVREINKNPDLIMIYSDEDKLLESGLRDDPYFKPKYNPDLLLSQNYITHFLVLKTDVAKKLGGFRKGTEGSQDHDIILRASIFIKKDEDVAHIPKILYHWRVWAGSTASSPDVKPYAWVNGRKAIEDFLKAKGIFNAKVDFGKNEGTYRVYYEIPKNVYASIIIAGASDKEFIKELLHQINKTISHEKYEIILLIEEGKKKAY
jgi:Glycosyltransferases, probably involved in cell wall biogenesis